MTIISYTYGVRYSPQLSKKLFGYRDSTAGGKYTYDRPGLLSPYSWRRIGKNVLVVDKKHARTLINVMRRNGLVVKEVETQL